MMYKICPECGASLDPGEKCDCCAEKGKSPAAEAAEDFQTKIKNNNYLQYTAKGGKCQEKSV